MIIKFYPEFLLQIILYDQFGFFCKAGTKMSGKLHVHLAASNPLLHMCNVIIIQSVKDLNDSNLDEFRTSLTEFALRHYSYCTS